MFQLRRVFSPQLSSALWNGYCHRGLSRGHSRRSFSSDPASESNATNSRPPKASFFFDDRVQCELRFQTGLNPERVFRVSRRGQKITTPDYRFVTEEELSSLRAAAAKAAEQKLQMPPVLDTRTPCGHTIHRDPAITGYDIAKTVFTDITYGVQNRKRLIVVREPDGELRHADWDERDRMNQVYFPSEGRKIDMPHMFTDKGLKDILRPDKYEYILDRCCVQFEPDHPMFVRTCATVFDAADAENAYDALHSTRHFGPMVFHLVWENKADGLMGHYLENKAVERACSLAKVFGLLHGDSATANAMAEQSEDDLFLLRAYINQDSRKKSKLHAALESALEAKKMEIERAEGIAQAHGAKSPPDT